MINEKLEIIITRWFKCEITGDEAMSQIVKSLAEEERSKDEIINACTKEKS
ncbi:MULTISPECIES: hypothetical protein [unclassified Clostridium]|uniref:hypothetical protein n=1 Tax=unclassified Clostridium TaxID=2614128 RepID=UPI000297938F|nr:MULTISPECIES: hypothetical protein [unclassified Clostridium]EKQ50282.1 MAG: hypothetical protein A370_05728 [Clostridium sp. Maddingley MBC34-26]